MRNESRLFDDLARMAGGARESAGALRDEIEARIRDRIESVLERMDLVRRDEFDAVRAMAVEARKHNEALETRLAALEAAAGKARETPGETQGAAPGEAQDGS